MPLEWSDKNDNDNVCLSVCPSLRLSNSKFSRALFLRLSGSLWLSLAI